MKKLLFFVSLFVLIGCVPEEPAKQPFEGRELVKFEELNQFAIYVVKKLFA